MDLGTITAVIIGTVMGMAALIKTMVLGRLEQIQKDLSGLSKDMHRLDVRLTKLETEHAVHTCMRDDR
jgi:hypothetical protein